MSGFGLDPNAGMSLHTDKSNHMHGCIWVSKCMLVCLPVCVQACTNLCVCCRVRCEIKSLSLMHISRFLVSAWHVFLSIHLCMCVVSGVKHNLSISM